MMDARISAIQQMQRMQKQATGEASLTEQTPRTSFGQMMKEYVQDVNDMEAHADDQIRRSIAGEDVDAHTVMLAVEKANIAFEMVMQIRNKMLDAYQQVMKTQV